MINWLRKVRKREEYTVQKTENRQDGGNYGFDTSKEHGQE